VKRFIVVENLKRWPLNLQGAEVVSARDYLVDPVYTSSRRAAVFNLCREYRYQSLGYYVSLLAAARGHRPIPDVGTLQDLGAGPAVRVVAESLDELVQKSLAPIRTSEFELSIYFGRNVAKRHDALSRAIFNAFPAPFLRARFTKQLRWRLSQVRTIAGIDIPDAHQPFVIEQCERYFAGGRGTSPRRELRYDMAILWQPDDAEPPSDSTAIRRIIRAAGREGFAARVIGPEDYGRLAEFDALFIRETTAVNHHTYRFARRAEAQGLVVIDDTDSILRCTNKVFQAEIFHRHDVSTPRTLIVHGRNVGQVESEVGFPCVLKRPDSSFSLGVTRVDTPEELEVELAAAFHLSPLVIVQAWTPTAFDWRIGVLAGVTLFACRYHMVRGHWQIAAGGGGGRRRYGRVEAVPLEAVPAHVLDVAVRAARLMGDGLYGVDVKDVDGQALVMEVNDNPNIDAGNEDAVLKDELYAAIARHFRQAVDRRGGEINSP
jgi:glutathione synthase/RimK-type ligase-like ATP-grasp enzyme